MKRLWKHEWKYYLSFMVIMMVILLLGQDVNWLTEFGFEDSSNLDFLNFQIGNALCLFFDGTMGYFIQSTVLKCVIGILAFKSAFFWLEKDSYGREFMQTLPVTRLERMVFHLIMDSLVILIPVTCSGVYVYYRSMNVLESIKLAVPGFTTSIFLSVVIVMVYLLFILCLINMLESQFAGGFTRIVGTAGNIFIGFLLLCFVSELFKKIEWIQYLCSFFALGAKGIFFSTESEEQMMENLMDITVYYKGESVTIPVEYDVYRYLSNTDRGWYIGCLVGYVVLVVLLAGIAIFLVKRQEQSKRDFYFASGRYLTSGLISAVFCTMLLLNANAVWHACLIVLASILLFVMLSYWMDMDRKPLKKS